jgi:thioredoxin-like negative regulator of GroEL
MKRNWKTVAIVAVLAAVWGGYMLRDWMAGNVVLAETFDANVPTLMELGASWCPACRAMKPVMKRLQDGYAGFNVKYVDVENDTGMAVRYEVSTIPVIVFVSPKGTTLYSQVGGMSKSEVLAKWKELGVGTSPKPQM